MNSIIYTIIVALAIGFLLGLLLGLFKKIFAVKTDPKIDEIRESLPGANCGGCGYAGCDSFAQALAKGEASVTGCVAGGESCAKALAKIMGLEGASVTPKVALLACHGTKECALDKCSYEGIQSCAACELSAKGLKKCAFGCIGLADCVKACQFGALSMGSDGLPHVDKNKCTGCGMCVKTCPKKLFVLMDINTKGSVALCSCKSDNKPQIKKDCSNGCFKCGLCAKKCSEGCIDLSSGIPSIDYSKCTSCGECVKACPDKVLHLFEEL